MSFWSVLFDYGWKEAGFRPPKVSLKVNHQEKGALLSAWPLEVGCSLLCVLSDELSLQIDGFRWFHLAPSHLPYLSIKRTPNAYFKLNHL